MRILYVTSYYKPAYIYGGPIRSISTLCEELVKTNIDVTVFTTNANGLSRLDVPLGQPMDIEGVKVWYFPLFGNGLNFSYSPELALALKMQLDRFDLVVAEVLWGHALKPIANLCRRKRIPYIISLRGQLLPWSFEQKRLKKQIYLSLFGYRYINGASALYCTDPGEAEEAVKLRLGAPTFVVPNGVDTSRFFNLPKRGNFRKRLNIPDQAAVLLFMGRLHPKKRPDLAIEALAAAQSLPGETHLVLAGPDEMQMISKLQAQAQYLGCANRLHITGLLQGDEILAVLADADLFLMPSEPESENFGMSAAEAMAAGLPILVSEGVPIGHWAELAGAGRIVPCTVDAFRTVTCELLALPDQLKEMGKRGQELVRQRFEISSVAQQMLAQYKSIIELGQPLFANSQEILLGIQE